LQLKQSTILSQQKMKTKMTIPDTINSKSRSPLRLAFLLIPLALTCFALSPSSRAVTPTPDGGYPGENTAEGDDALFSLTTGTTNTATGFDALYTNTTGNDNTANGDKALFRNTTGSENTAIGANALFSNTTGMDNTATGFQALVSNISFECTADGSLALQLNTTGNYNTATGFAALELNTTGFDNTATGWLALQFNRTGSGNTAVGHAALQSNAGNNNIALGSLAGTNLTTGNNNIDIGNFGVADEGNTIRVGTQGTQRSAFVAGISATAVTGRAVMISSTGQLGVTPSSVRFKDAIKPMDNASEAILVLKPVTFRYKHELDPDDTPQFGLVAEDVEKVNPDLVARDDKGKPYTVRYEAVNAMLLNEFLKEHSHVQEQDAIIARQQKQIDTLTAAVQKVSTQLELNKRAPETASNN
jgi:Chaperone of endosialidase